MNGFYKLTKEDGSELTAQEAYEAAMQGPCYIILKYGDNSLQKLSAEIKQIKPLEAASYDGDYYYGRKGNRCLLYPPYITKAQANCL